MSCSCEACSELDWIIDEHLVVRSECIIVCGSLSAAFLNFPPILFVEISSQKKNSGIGILNIICMNYRELNIISCQTPKKSSRGI